MRSTTVEKLQDSIATSIAIYKQDLKKERRRLRAALRKTACPITGKPLEERLSAINSELAKLAKGNNGSRFVGVAEEWKITKEELSQINLRR